MRYRLDFYKATIPNKRRLIRWAKRTGLNPNTTSIDVEYDGLTQTLYYEEYDISDPGVRIRNSRGEAITKPKTKHLKKVPYWVAEGLVH